jgi:hypothetical protein
MGDAGLLYLMFSAGLELDLEHGGRHRRGTRGPARRAPELEGTGRRTSSPRRGSGPGPSSASPGLSRRAPPDPAR